MYDRWFLWLTISCNTHKLSKFIPINRSGSEIPDECTPKWCRYSLAVWRWLKHCCQQNQVKTPTWRDGAGFKSWRNHKSFNYTLVLQLKNKYDIGTEYISSNHFRLIISTFYYQNSVSTNKLTYDPCSEQWFKPKNQVKSFKFTFSIC